MAMTPMLTPAEEKFNTLCTQGQELFRSKNREYDSAFKRYGLIGVIYELLGALNRLAPMTIWREDRGKATREKLKDVLLDIHNYSIMALICLEDNNWDGSRVEFVYLKGDDND